MLPRLAPLIAALAALGGCGAGKLSSLEDTGTGTSETVASSGEESSNGSSSSSGDGDGDPTSWGFVPQDDTFDGEAGWCDPFAQDCPEAEKCVPYTTSERGTWDADKCVLVAGEQGLGQACVYEGPILGSDDCDETTLCWNALDVDGELVGTCFEFCKGSPDRPICSDPMTSCRFGNDGSVAVCLPACDPLLQDCEPGLGCYWNEDAEDFHCVPVAGPGRATGEPCGYNNDCAPGRFCADMAAVDGCMGSSCCVDYCELGLEPSICGMGTTCLPFFEPGMAPAEHVDLGLCVAVDVPAKSLPDAW